MCTPIQFTHTVDWWAGAAGALLGALIGSCVPLAWSAWMRRKERSGEITAMQVEMYHAKLAMNALRTAGIQAPLYHLPLTMFERALPKLIGEGRLTPNEISGLVEYVMRAEELNRGLDLASAAALEGPRNAAAVAQQYNRNVAKVTHILDEKQDRLGGMTAFAVAEEALYRVGGDSRPDESPIEGT
jgi:hypothetical protein